MHGQEFSEVGEPFLIFFGVWSLAEIFCVIRFSEFGLKRVKRRFFALPSVVYIDAKDFRKILLV